MLARYIYSRRGIMYEVLYEVFHAVIQFTQYTLIYVGFACVPVPFSTDTSAYYYACTLSSPKLMLERLNRYEFISLL
jgi:hypothetical protein